MSGAHYYDCPRLLSDAEVRQATGLPDAAVFTAGSSKGPIPGQTYCQYFAQQGALSIAVSVFTGPSERQVFEPLAQAGAGLPSIPGVGDEAKWSDQSHALGIRADGVGITIIFAATGGSPSDIKDLEGAAVAMGKLVVSRL